MKKRSFFQCKTTTNKFQISENSIVFSAEIAAESVKIKKTTVTKKEKPHYNVSIYTLNKTLFLYYKYIITYCFKSLQKTHDLRWQTKLIARVFKGMSEEKKNIVEEMEFGVLPHIPEMNISRKLLKELIRCYDAYNGWLETLYCKIYITPAKIRDDRFPQKVEYRKLSEEQKEIIDSFKGATLASLTKSVIDMSVEGEENQMKFKRTFVVFVQKCFLLPTTVSIVSPIQKPLALHVDTVQQWDWTSHVLSFLRKGIKAQREGKKLSVDDCVFILMLIYFHESKFSRPEADDAPGTPWVAYWTRRNLVNQIALETTNEMRLVNRAELRGGEIEEKKMEKKTVFLKGKKKEKEKKEKKKIRRRKNRENAAKEKKTTIKGGEKTNQNKEDCSNRFGKQN
ncbi:hypothetical protein Ahy_B10g105287 [Arachis hypogaea]|uniref:Aminotransferase-like plant mobile domain-containing protein n=1 Tax=Arachis hypogaea TaxID=3818 RepID=A0A444X7L9_ARAHY|nr:hypothetical protein Ahy_B10g105287 [Arachis hypogaea]